MAANPSRERRPAVWPWLALPLIVLVVYYALYRVHQPPHDAPAAAPQTQSAPAGTATPQQ